jgi:hypothetical protein
LNLFDGLREPMQAVKGPGKGPVNIEPFAVQKEAIEEEQRLPLCAVMKQTDHE